MVCKKDLVLKGAITTAAPTWLMEDDDGLWALILYNCFSHTCGEEETIVLGFEIWLLCIAFKILLHTCHGIIGDRILLWFWIIWSLGLLPGHMWISSLLLFSHVNMKTLHKFWIYLSYMYCLLQGDSVFKVMWQKKKKWWVLHFTDWMIGFASEFKTDMSLLTDLWNQVNL